MRRPTNRCLTEDANSPAIGRLRRGGSLRDVTVQRVADGKQSNDCFGQPASHLVEKSMTTSRKIIKWTLTILSERQFFIERIEVSR
jgi:hypothetical protein